MKRRKQGRQSGGDPFERIARAADAAADEVLEEDRKLRDFGIEPPNGRSR